MTADDQTFVLIWLEPLLDSGKEALDKKSPWISMRTSVRTSNWVVSRNFQLPKSDTDQRLPKTAKASCETESTFPLFLIPLIKIM